MSLGMLSDVPASFIFFVNGNGVSPEPDRGIIWTISTSARLSQSDGCFLSGYLDREFEHFSPTF